MGELTALPRPLAGFEAPVEERFGGNRRDGVEGVVPTPCKAGVGASVAKPQTTIDLGLEVWGWTRLGIAPLLLGV